MVVHILSFFTQAGCIDFARLHTFGSESRAPCKVISNFIDAMLRVELYKKRIVNLHYASHKQSLIKRKDT